MSAPQVRGPFGSLILGGVIAGGVLLVLLGAGMAAVGSVGLSAANAGHRMPLFGIPRVRPRWPTMLATTAVFPAAAGAVLGAHAKHALAGWAWPAAVVVLMIAGVVPILRHNAALPRAAAN